MSRKQNTKDDGKAKMRGGQFSQMPGEVLQKINSSIGFDKKLYKEDIAASSAHAKMLTKQGIISKKDGDSIVSGLSRILKSIEDGSVKFSDSLEDIHMNIEALLKGLAGNSAGRLHTARSRNDQVATDFKLWVRNRIDEITTEIKKLRGILVARAEENASVIMPGFTHLQPAQPVTFGHHLMAYYEMFSRDQSRFNDARRRLNTCPLGAAALAGTSFPTDRAQTAKELGFDGATGNSLDSVSDRDFALEFLSAASITAMHLSRLAEEIVLWCSPQFKFITLSEKFTTGSSIMPQKRNPDAAELVRSKTGRVYGALVALLTVMKALPLAYNKDMQEDKEPVFDAAETILICLQAVQGMLLDLKVNAKNMLKAAASGFSTATDLADWLVRELDIPIRDAHHITGKALKLAENKNCGLADLSLKDLQRLEARINDKVFSVLSVENSVKSRKSYGGTAPDNVLAQVKKAKQDLK
jgi:argininosuccinate lyase